MRKNCLLLVSILLFSMALPMCSIGEEAPMVPVTQSRGRGDYLNFTYLENGMWGSTAYRVTDGNVVIYIAAFPADAYCELKPEDVYDADIIIQEKHHSHSTHYDADSVYTAQNNSDAIVVGNADVIWDMEDRGVESSKLVRMEPTTTSKVTTNIPGFNVKITAYLMPHTGSSSINVITFLIEMPNGMKWFHGGCYSNAGTDHSSSMKAYTELNDLDVMLVDFDHDMDSIDSYFKPMVIGEIHDYSSSPWTSTVWEDYPGNKRTLSHGDFYIYPPEYPVHLINRGFTPNDGDTNTTFSFDVLYNYRPNTGPTSSKIWLDGTLYDMTLNGTDFREGVTYSYETKLSYGAGHEYHVEFEVNGQTYRLPETGEKAGPIVNAIPVLEPLAFDPVDGNTDTEFTFSTLFSDLDGAAPIKSNVFIDGSSYLMTTEGSDFIAGVNYSFSTSLSIGLHYYYFLFSDGKSEVRYPASGELTGPDVVRANYAPHLTKGKVDPGEGVRSYTYKFTVTYRDGEDDPATVFKAVIDGESMNMTAKGGVPSAGITYELSTNLTLGLHPFHFEFSDGVFDIRLPAEGEFDGPNVTNILPHIRIHAPLNFDEFDDGHPVEFNASETYDVDGDNLTFTWTSSLDGEIGTGSSMEALLSAGEHTITLSVDDGFGGVVLKELEISVIHLYVVIGFVIGMSPGDPGEGEFVDLEVVIDNSGNKPSGPLTFTLMIDGAVLKSQHFENIIEGGVVRFSSSFIAVPGDHELTVEVSNGMIETYNFTVDTRAAPVAVAGADITAYVGDEVSLDGSNSTGVGLVYYWIIGNISESGGIFPFFTPMFPGTYGIILTVTDDLGKEDTVTLTLTVEPRPEVPIQEEPKEKGSGGAIVVVIGSLVVLLLIGAVLAFVLMRKRKGSSREEETTSQQRLPVDQSHLPPELRDGYQPPQVEEGYLPPDPYIQNAPLPYDPIAQEGQMMGATFDQSMAVDQYPPVPAVQEYPQGDYIPPQQGQVEPVQEYPQEQYIPPQPEQAQPAPEAVPQEPVITEGMPEEPLPAAEGQTPPDEVPAPAEQESPAPEGV
ncbi:MAG: hypothetical protein KAH57_05985 [Thermoplasmata archaeon]|nr:hypothetical protein [Thermoplasmata archaeon]